MCVCVCAAPVVAEQLQLANDMGLFLQKTNIIRDYLEVCVCVCDTVAARPCPRLPSMWPESVCVCVNRAGLCGRARLLAQRNLG